MTIEELRERLSAIDEELNAIMAELDAPEEEPAEDEKRASTEELETRSAKLMEERQGIMAEIEKAEKALEEEKRAMTEVIANNDTEIIEKREDEKMADIEIRNTQAYIDAYANYIKSGDDTECRSLLTENATGGTVPVPELVYDIVKTAWEREGITARVRKAYIKGNLKVGFELSAGDATVHTEGGGAVTEESLVLGTVSIIPKSIKKWISLTDESIDIGMGSENFLRYVYDELTYKIAKKAADELIAQIQACGTVSTNTQVGVPKLTASTVGVGTIAQAMALLSDEAANPVVMMNKATWGAFKSAQYANGFDADPFEGLDVLFNNTIPSVTVATTGVTYAIVGDLDHGALMNLPNGEGIDFKYDDLSQAEYDLVRIIGREFVGIGVVAPNAFVKIVK
jgi:HK97 family phage major capsid protein